jgi:hypothetical protein
MAVPLLSAFGPFFQAQYILAAEETPSVAISPNVSDFSLAEPAQQSLPGNADCMCRFVGTQKLRAAARPCHPN